MTLRRHVPLASAVLAVALLSACGRNDPAPAAGDATQPGASQQAPQTMIGKAARKGIDKARREILAGNISLDGGFQFRGPNVRVGGESRPGTPKAELTPQGDLLVDGKKVAVDASQQALLKRYRGQVEQVALAGMEIGVQGADLAGKAVTEAIGGIFNGNSDGIEQRVEAQADGIKAAARALCGHLPALYETQQALAASVPEFKPYATMEQSDIDDCMKDTDAPAQAGRDAARTEVRNDIRNGIRGAVQAAAGAVDSAARRNNAAAEAEEASVQDAKR